MDTVTKGEWWVFDYLRPNQEEPTPYTTSYTDDRGQVWEVSKKANEGEYPATQGAKILDTSAGMAYSATIERVGRTPYLTSLEVAAAPGHRINSSLLADLPVERLARAVAQFIDAKEADDLDPKGMIVIPPDAVVLGRGETPNLHQLAEDFNAPDARPRDVIRTYRHRYDVSESTVNRWIRKARSEGLIAPPDGSHVGRPKTTDAAKEK